MERQPESVQFRSDISVEMIQHVGSDDMIASAARVSVAGIHVSEKTEDEKLAGLINYLMAHRHGSPFEHGTITVRVHAPIFVWREWHRHRIGFSFNEESARYKALEPVFWIPRRDRKAVPSVSHTSARPHFVAMTDDQYTQVTNEMKSRHIAAYAGYRRLLNANIAKEVARAVLPVAIYSACYVTCNPRSLMHFLSLRTHRPDAKFVSYPQAEIQEAAESLERLFAAYWPITHTAFLKNGRVAP